MVQGKTWTITVFTALASAMLAAPCAAQIEKQVLTIHSPSIDGNLQGNSADRDLVVFLPESYAAEPAKRYPVVIVLHGFGGSAKGFAENARIGAAMEAANSEFIIVIPDGNSVFGGSIYANSPTTGNYEGFITQDVIAYVDSHYRTLATRESRGIAGHSMGGCGALKLAMKHAETFSAIYAMSPTCVTLLDDTEERLAAASSLSEDEVADAPFSIRAMYALASAWSPAPDKPPFFLEWPDFDGDDLSPALARWAANLPLAMVPQYTGALNSMTAIAMDVGERDSGLGKVAQMDRELSRFAVSHRFEVYDGDHSDRVPERLQAVVLPFFAKHLKAE